jgi:uncharacterized protein YbaA (DUF1428 family)
MMHYVDGYVLPVPRRNLGAYRRMARDAGKIWRQHGALQYVETVADDVKPGTWTSFPRSVKLKRGEVVVFSFIVYRSRGQRDRINRKVMKKFMSDPKWKKYMDPRNMPFDGKRMFWGGFRAIVEF